RAFRAAPAGAAEYERRQGRPRPRRAPGRAIGSRFAEADPPMPWLDSSPARDPTPVGWTASEQHQRTIRPIRCGSLATIATHNAICHEVKQDEITTFCCAHPRRRADTVTHGFG